mgnify:FL=1|jgi:hypothetical protein
MSRAAWIVLIHLLTAVDVHLYLQIPKVDYHYGLEYILMVVYFISLQLTYFIYYGTASYIDRHE